MIKRIVKRILTKKGLVIYKKSESQILGLINNGYGHSNSKRQSKPLFKDNTAIPWFTYPAIEYLNKLDISNKSVFEWGSGHSSIYFSHKASTITSIESNQEWFKYIKGKKLKNHQIHKHQGEDYYKAILGYNNFDIIIIDGDKRAKCAEYAIDKINSDGLIILDNSDWFPNVCSFLRKKGFVQIDFMGIGPINDYSWSTSFFLAKNFSLKFRNEDDPYRPIGGLIKFEKDVKNQ